MLLGLKGAGDSDTCYNTDELWGQLCSVKSASEGKTNRAIPLTQFLIPWFGKVGGQFPGNGKLLKNSCFGLFHFSHSDLVGLESGTVPFPKLWKLWLLEHWSALVTGTVVKGGGSWEPQGQMTSNCRLVSAQTALGDSPRGDNHHIIVSSTSDRSTWKYHHLGTDEPFLKKKFLNFQKWLIFFPGCYFGQSSTSVSAGHRNFQALLILCTRHLTENSFHWLLLGTKAKPGDFCKEAALVTMRLFAAMTL